MRIGKNDVKAVQTGSRVRKTRFGGAQPPSRTVKRTRNTPLSWKEALKWLAQRQTPTGTREMAIELGISQGHAYILLERMRLFGTARHIGFRSGGRLYEASRYGKEMGQSFSDTRLNHTPSTSARERIMP